MTSKSDQDTSEWERAVFALLVAILLLGIFTIWQVYLVAPPFLFTGAIAVYLILLLLTALTRLRILQIYPIDALIGIGLVVATVSQPEHLQIALGGAMILPRFIIIVGNILALFMAATSLYISWRRFSPQLQARIMEHQNVHANCAKDAPCRTQPGYRV